MAVLRNYCKAHIYRKFSTRNRACVCVFFYRKIVTQANGCFDPNALQYEMLIDQHTVGHKIIEMLNDE